MWAPSVSQNLLSVLDERDYLVSHSSPVVCGATFISMHLSWIPGSFPKVASLGEDHCPYFTKEDPHPPAPHLPGGRVSSQDLEPVFPTTPWQSAKGPRAMLVTRSSWQPRVQAWKHPPDLTLSRTDSRSLANCVRSACCVTCRPHGQGH